MIKTVFFDLDNVIISDDLLHFKFFEMLWMFLRKHDWQWTFERVIEEKNELIQRWDDPNPHVTVARYHLSEKDFKDYLSQIRYFTKRHRNKYIKVIPGMPFVIRNLNHAYNLGIIANQSEEDYNFVTNYKITVPFQTVALSSRLNHAKPDPEIFRWALRHAKTKPEEAVMIGDSRELDILPAQQIGMNTIRAIFDYKIKGIFPQSSREKLYFRTEEKESVDSRESLLAAISNLQTARRTDIAALSIAAGNPDEILTGIAKFETESSGLSESQPEEEKIIEAKQEEKSWKDILKEIIAELSEQP